MHTLRPMPPHTCRLTPCQRFAPALRLMTGLRPMPAQGLTPPHRLTPCQGPRLIIGAWPAHRLLPAHWFTPTLILYICTCTCTTCPEACKTLTPVYTPALRLTPANYLMPAHHLMPTHRLWPAQRLVPAQKLTPALKLMLAHRPTPQLPKAGRRQSTCPYIWACLQSCMFKALAQGQMFKSRLAQPRVKFAKARNCVCMGTPPPGPLKQQNNLCYKHIPRPGPWDPACHRDNTPPPHPRAQLPGNHPHSHIAGLGPELRIAGLDPEPCSPASLYWSCRPHPWSPYPASPHLPHRPSLLRYPIPQHSSPALQVTPKEPSAPPPPPPSTQAHFLVHSTCFTGYMPVSCSWRSYVGRVLPRPI